MILRGNIYYVSNHTATGSEQCGRRPAVIVSNNAGNATSKTVEIVYLTTKPKTDLPTHVVVRSAPQPSTALCEQITCVSTDRLEEFVGACTAQEMERINYALRISLDLNI